MSIQILRRSAKYPPIHDGNQVAYLLLHLGVPSHGWPACIEEVTAEEHFLAAKEAGEALGFTVWPICLYWEERPSRGLPRADGRPICQGDLRYLFRFAGYQRNDERALKVSESILYAISITFSSPILPSDELSLVFRVPAGLIQDEDNLAVEKLLQVEEARAWDEKTIDFPTRSIPSATFVSEYHVEAAWRIAPLLFQNEKLRRAAQFLKASQDSFSVPPGGTENVLARPDQLAVTGFEQTMLENALHNAFKSIEAVIGDLSKDNRKFFLRLRAMGLDPNEDVGYASKAPLHEVIRAMNKARDKKSAHGSTPDRAITIAEMMEYQACAHYVVFAAVETELGRDLYGEPD